MNRNVIKLLIIRGLRSIGQGALVVDLTLYLKQLLWSGAAIGGATTGAGIVGALLILIVGIASDRYGRKPFLIVYEAITMVAAVVTSLTTSGIWLVLAIMIAGFGRGQSGAAGPFSPAEQALLARYVKREERGSVFSINNAIGFFGMAIGALLGAVPHLYHQASPIASYRPVFLTVGIFSFLCLIMILTIKEPTFMRQVQVRDKTQEESIRKKENHAILLLALVNTLNGLAVGLTGPLMAYWFSLRYGVSTGAIGSTMAISFFLTGLFSLFSGRLAGRIGIVRSVTWFRIIGSILMVATPFMPTFWLASLLFILRSATNRSTQGNRTALSANLTRDERRGFSVSVNALSMRLPSSLGPLVSGYLFDSNMLSLPLFLTAILQFANAIIYQRIFGSFDKGE
nr:MFS transporter [Bacilli bacterium]